ncbi:MAG TPA: lytic murein transglycosylase, partial [Hyphomicrobiaceae bacterium]|nr:lytic murein transglycosylase [Hyphomicrobiaceae bacterium]
MPAMLRPRDGRLLLTLFLTLSTTVVLVLAGGAGTTATAAGMSQYPSRPNNCQPINGPFDAWIGGVRSEALKRGIRPQTIARALDGITHDPDIIRIDRGQSFFAQSFLEFSAKLATGNRVTNGKAQMRKFAGTFERAEAEFGVPAPVITAFWALESDFGAGIGKRPVIRSLVTLAWDCRRSEMFREELFAALTIIDRGDLVPEEMISSWAGELGQTQFLPTHYAKSAVDYDGDGKRNLFKSPADIIGSTANFIRSLGWTKGQPWLEEVQLPASLPWEKAGLDVKLARSEWATLGVRLANGQPLAADGLEASLIILQGRGGPAFLAYPNFKIFTEWNQSLNYATTAAYLATRLDGAGPMSRGPSPGQPLTMDQLKDLQTLLVRGGYGDV